MTPATFFSLGRVSNLPTVWSNCLAGLALSGVAYTGWHFFMLAVAMTLAYIGGMFLNDAFDHQFDNKHRPERPIPAGHISAPAVYSYGGLMLAACLVIVIGVANGNGIAILPAALSASALVFVIVLYNAWHKNNPAGPLIMGLCRAFVYCTAVLAITNSLSSAVILVALAMVCYIVGLTWVAKQENIGEVQSLLPMLFLSAPLFYGITQLGHSTISGIFLLLLVAWIAVALYFLIRKQPGDIPRAVVSMIAGISLADAVFIATTGQYQLAIVAVLCFALTLLLQKFVSGT